MKPEAPKPDYNAGQSHAYGNAGIKPKPKPNVMGPYAKKRLEAKQPRSSALDSYDPNKPHGQQWTPEMEKEHREIWDRLVNGGSGEAESSYNDGMQHAYRNIGEGIKLEQQRKADGYNEGRAHAFGNMKPEYIPDSHAYAHTGGTEGLTEKTMQMVRNPENAYGIGTGGAHGLTDKTKLMVRNPENAYAIGTGGVEPGDAAHKYAQGTGGVEGNFKPQELREAEQVVDQYELALMHIEELTGRDANTAIGIIEEMRNNNALDGTWAKAAELLDEVRDETGMTYIQAERNKAHMEERFDKQTQYSNVLENAGIHEYTAMLLQEITGKDPAEALSILDDLVARNGKLTGEWADAYEVVKKAEEMTGVSYLGAMTAKSDLDVYFKKEGITDVISSNQDFQMVVGIKTLLETGMIDNKEAAATMESLGIPKERMGLIDQLIEFDKSSSAAKKLDDAEKAKEPSNEKKHEILQQVIKHASDDVLTEIIEQAYGDGAELDLSNVQIRGFDMYKLSGKEARDLHKKENKESTIMMIASGTIISALLFPAGAIAAGISLASTTAAGVVSAVDYGNSEEPTGGTYFNYDIVVTTPEGEKVYIEGRIAPGEENPLNNTYHFKDY